MDGDGDLDLLTANQSDNTVSVRLNDGQGTFSGGSDPAVGNFPQSVAVGDVDGDGDLDLLTANSSDNTVSVRLNDGHGTFSGGSDPAVGTNPRSVAVGDVDGDGDLDLLTANSSDNTVSVRLNDGHGTFSGGSDPAVGTNPQSVAVGDVDGDGDLDLLAANYSDNTVSVRLNDGHGTFSGGSDPAVGGPVSVAVGDVDGDGDLDLLAATLFGNTVSVRLNDGQGTFSGGSNPAVGSSPAGVAVGDVDGDGDLDLLVTNYGDNTVSVRLNDGQGTFSGGSNPAVGSSPAGVAVGDVDGDGDLDLLVTNYDANTVSVRLNQVLPLTLANLSPTSGPVGTSVTLTGTGFTGATGVRFNGSAATTFSVSTATTATATVPPGATTGPVTLTTPGGTSNGVGFAVVTDLTVSATQAIPGGTYASITVTGTGVATLAGPVAVSGALTVQAGGVLHTNCQSLTGAGTFTLAAGATLGLCDPAGLAASGARGAVQLAGARSFSSDASYLYNGTAAQVTGAGLPATVRNLTTTNAAGLTLSQDVAVTTALAVTTGVLTTGSRRATLAPGATLSETETAYVTGNVAATRPLVPGTAESFGGLGLTLTPTTGSASPGATPVVRTTGTALTGTGTSVSVLRSFDIQPAVNTGLNVAMDFAYFTHELNGIAPATLALFKSETGAAGPWANQRPVTLSAGTNTVRKTGIADFSLWTLGNAAAPLPVELRAFAAERQGEAARLSWATASETNSAYFEAEASVDGRAFRAVGRVTAQGTSPTPHAYELSDPRLLAYGVPAVYYRLRQVDGDGTARYSPVRTLAVDGRPAAFQAVAWPNPAGADRPTLLLVSGPASGHPVELTLTDAAGRVLARRLVSAAAAAAGPVALPEAAGQPAGVYLLVVRQGAAQRVLRLLRE